MPGNCQLCGTVTERKMEHKMQAFWICDECASEFSTFSPEFSTLSFWQIQDAFEFLDELRDSGRTNMFGASPYLQKEWWLDQGSDDRLPKNTADRLVQLWMRTFSRRASAREAM